MGRLQGRVSERAARYFFSTLFAAIGGADGHNRAHAVGCVERQPQGEQAAIGVADQVRRLEFKLVEAGQLDSHLTDGVTNLRNAPRTYGIHHLVLR